MSDGGAVLISSGIGSGAGDVEGKPNMAYLEGRFLGGYALMRPIAKGDGGLSAPPERPDRS
jgi:hypothetical protein